MTEKYAPTKHELAEAWVVPGQRLRHAEQQKKSGWERAREADRGIRQIQADAWDEGKEDAMRGLDIHGDTNAENPYREAPNE